MAFFDPREKAQILVKVNMQEDKGTEEPLHRLDSTSDSRQTAELFCHNKHQILFHHPGTSRFFSLK